MRDRVNETIDTRDSAAAPERCFEHLRPRDQPESVAELSAALLRPFEVVGASLAVTGCLFEEVPFVAAGERRSWFDPSGREVTAEFADSLGLNDSIALERPHRGMREIEGASWIAERFPDSIRSAEPIAVVWARWARGKLTVAAPARSVDLEFEGWARHLATGRTRVAPFRCPETGASGDRIVVSDDGEPTVPEALGICAVSGRRRLVSHLVPCGVSGALASADRLTECPVSGIVAIPSTLVRCDWCATGVAPSVLVKQVCSLCRDGVPLNGDSTWLDWLADHEPDASAWRWSFASSRIQGVLVGRRWPRRLALHVVRMADRQALRSRIRSVWGSWVTRFDAQSEVARPGANATQPE